MRAYHECNVYTIPPCLPWRNLPLDVWGGFSPQLFKPVRSPRWMAGPEGAALCMTGACDKSPGAFVSLLLSCDRWRYWKLLEDWVGWHWCYDFLILAPRLAGGCWRKGSMRRLGQERAAKVSRAYGEMWQHFEMIWNVLPTFTYCVDTLRRSASSINAQCSWATLMAAGRVQWRSYWGERQEDSKQCETNSCAQHSRARTATASSAAPRRPYWSKSCSSAPLRPNSGTGHQIPGGAAGFFDWAYIGYSPDVAFDVVLTYGWSQLIYLNQFSSMPVLYHRSGAIVPATSPTSKICHNACACCAQPELSGPHLLLHHHRSLVKQFFRKGGKLAVLLFWMGI